MKPNRKIRKNQIWFLVAALLLLAAVVVGSVFLLRGEGKAPNPSDLQYANEDSSQILVTGKDYSLEKEQEEKYLEQQQEKEEQPPEEQPEQVAESIMRENPPNAEPAADPVVTVQPAENAVPVPQPGNNGGDNGNGGNGGEDDPRPQPEPETQPKQEASKMPYVEFNGDSVQGTAVWFQVRGLDYNRNVFTTDATLCSVTFDGALLYSSETSGDGWVTYRAENSTPGEHVVTATVTDKDGNHATSSMTITVQEEQAVPVEEYVTLYVEGDVIGRGTILYATGQIYANESAASFVRRMLESNGFSVNMDDSSYLERIWGVNPPDPAVVPAGLQDYVAERFGELGTSPGDGSLGARDYSPESGWVYMYNGWYQGVGLYGVTLHDGDEIHLGFTLEGGVEYNGSISW